MFSSPNPEETSARRQCSVITKYTCYSHLFPAINEQLSGTALIISLHPSPINCQRTIWEIGYDAGRNKMGKRPKTQYYKVW